MDLKKTVTYQGKMKGIRIVNNDVVDSNGTVVDLIGILKKAYGENLFDLSTTTKSEEVIEISPDECEDE